MGRYLVAFASVALSLLVRAVLAPYLGDHVPFLLFYPAILFASWYGGFWPGTLATVLSGAAAYAAFMNRAGTTVLPANEVLQMALFLSIGIAIASLNSRLTAAHTEARREAAIGLGRAERLDAIINTTVDGILVIDSRGVVEEFNRGAERLFGYTAGEVIGRNVNMLMPSPYHEGHDGYISRYLSTGEKKIIGSGRQVEGRRKGRQRISPAPVGGRNDDRRRSQVHRDAARLVGSRATRRSTARKRGALAVGDRIGGRRHHRDRQRRIG
jgi:two-component system sensor kinase FixL